MSDWYESMFRTPIRDDVTRPRLCPYTTAPPLVVPSPQASFRRRPQSSGAGMRKCSAVEDYARRGACPPLGSGWGGYRVAESAAPTRRTKSQLRLLIPWCAGDSRDERLVRTLSGDANRYSRRATKGVEREKSSTKASPQSSARLPVECQYPSPPRWRTARPLSKTRSAINRREID